MARPTYIEINTQALQHNIHRIQEICAHQQIIAMVKANAYGCGLTTVIPILHDKVDALGVACMEEAIQVRQLTFTPCILFQGIFSPEELFQVVALNLECVVHHSLQLEWILKTPLKKRIRVWIKVNTGMQRLGFDPTEVPTVLQALEQCEWVDNSIGLISHMACADEPEKAQNQIQIQKFKSLLPDKKYLRRSLANSALILSQSDQLYDVVRPGIMLYGVSPFKAKRAYDFNLKPVMRFISAISVIHTYSANQPIGYGGIWKTTRPSRIGIVAVGYGDGYPRHIMENTPVWISGYRAPIVGRVSMDMLTVDLTDIPETCVGIGTRVELWGEHIPVEEIALCANTIAYELLCQVSSRVRENTHLT